MKINLTLRYLDDLNDRMHSITVDSDTCVGQLKELSSKEFNIEKRHIDLSIDGETFDDSCLIQELPITDGSEITIKNKFFELLRRLGLKSSPNLSQEVSQKLLDGDFESDDLQDHLDLIELVDENSLENLLINVTEKFLENHDARLLLVVYALIARDVDKRSSMTKFIGEAWRKNADYINDTLIKIRSD